MERIEDVSILFGGNMNQHPHADHARKYVYLEKQDKNDKEHVGFEINRGEYNDSVNSEFGIKSMMMDLSMENNGFYLAIPSSYISDITYKRNILMMMIIRKWQQKRLVSIINY